MAFRKNSSFPGCGSSRYAVFAVYYAPMNSVESLRSSLRLYAVTPCGCAEEAVRAVLAGGATFLQIREKNLPREVFVEKARRFRTLCPSGVPYVVNDDLDVALASGADGAHIGQGDGSVAEARRKLGQDRILGVSATTVAEAVAAERDGADYLGVGAVFPTRTKDDAADVSPETLHAICASVRIPVVAIGGIGEDNLPRLAGSGVAGAAVVSALFGADDPEAATRRMDAATRAMVAAPVKGRKGALVDMDGTVLDSMWVWEATDRELVSRYNVANAPEVLRHLTTVVHLREGMDYLHDVCGVGESSEALRQEFRDRLRYYYEHRIPLLPGAREALEKMRAEGVRIALVTATEESLALAAFRRLGIEHLIDQFHCDVAKRNPEALYKVLDALGTGVFETTLYDDVPFIRSVGVQAGLCVRESL